MSGACRHPLPDWSWVEGGYCGPCGHPLDEHVWYARAWARLRRTLARWPRRDGDR